MHDVNNEIDDYTKSLNLNPKYYKAYYKRANTYMLIKKWKKALQDFDKAIAAKKNNPWYYFNRAEAFYHLQMFESAVEDYSKTIKLDKKFTQAYSYRGKIYADNLKKYRLAIADYEKILDQNPGESEAEKIREKIIKWKNKLAE